MHIGFTGTREGMSDFQKNELDLLFNKLILTNRGTTIYFHHGLCVGADYQAHKIFRDVVNSQGRIVGHPPIKEKTKALILVEDFYQLHPAKEYITRDYDIVDAISHNGILIAAPKGPEEIRSGTWTTVRYARKKKVEIVVLER